MRGVCVAVWLLISLGACNGSSTAPASNDVAIAVTPPNSNVFLGASEQMTATASDGRPLAGTWGSDNPGAVTVNMTTGLVTAISSGQSNIFFVADGR